MEARITAVGYVICLTALAVAVRDARCEAETTPSFSKKTYTYKTVRDCDIQLDVYRAGDDVVRPVVVWIHGGALINGSRQGLPRRLVGLCRTEGFALVSIDYRLAPEVKLPAIIEDVKDAFRWIREKGPDRCRLDPDGLVVAGGSAGGYLTMMTGICIEPRPTALVAYWGYGDVDGPWYARPSTHYRTVMSLIPENEARQGVGGRVLTGTQGNDAVRKGRSRYYYYLRQNGLWTKEVTGFDPDTQRRQLDPYCPVRNITARYPPILMIHGTEDTDVPYEQSAAMARELARHNVKHELVTVAGAGHGLGGGDKNQVARAHERALVFIKVHLRRGGSGGP